MLSRTGVGLSSVLRRSGDPMGGERAGAWVARSPRMLEDLEGRTLLSGVIESDNTAVRIDTNVGSIVLELFVDETPPRSAAS
ncbi:MAG: hypothetical protein AAGK04_14375, partial [Planctomycetota bacterium]